MRGLSLRAGFALAGIGLAALIAVLWLTGALAGLERAAAEGQRAAQDALARALRALKAGEAGATGGLMALAFGYGVFHAAGPGHGKLLIGGYGLASGARARALAAIAVLSSLAQATMAVAVVYAGVLVFGWTRERMVGVTEDMLAPAGTAAIGLIGLWLAWRGVRHLRAARAEAGGHHGHDHDHDHACGCGHAHGPTAEEVARLRGARDAAALIAGIAARPCTGALFLLILTWQMGIGAAGVAAAYAMGIGTAAVTVAVALGSAALREGAVAALARSRALALGLPLLEIAAGAVIALAAARLLARTL